jgi:hypothetical protein
MQLLFPIKEGPVAKHKTVTHTHLPAPVPPPPAALPPAPRLAAQLFVVAGELVAVAIFAVGLATVVGWVVAGPEMRSTRSAQRSGPPPTSWVCRLDRWHGKQLCWPAYRQPVRRYYERDGV